MSEESKKIEVATKLEESKDKETPQVRVFKVTKSIGRKLTNNSTIVRKTVVLRN
jgi:hypothetical protein